MRVLSKFDKEFIKNASKLNQLTSLGSLNSIMPIDIDSEVFIVGRKSSDIDEPLYHKVEIQGPADSISRDYLEVTHRFYETNDLLKYLLENGYLLRFDQVSSLGLYINLIKEKEKIRDLQKQEIYIDKQIRQFLDNCTYYYRPTEALLELTKSRFKTKEERNILCTRKISIAAIIISLFGLLFNLINQDSANKKINILTIDTIAVDYLLKGLNKSSQDSSFIKKALFDSLKRTKRSSKKGRQNANASQN